MKPNKSKVLKEYHTTDDISYEIIYERIKNTYIQIKDGQVIVKAPKSASITYIENIIKRKKLWIIKKQKEQNNKQTNIYKDGAILRILGRPYTLKINYTLAKRNQIYVEGTYIYCNMSEALSRDNEQQNVKKLIDKYYKYVATQEVPAAMEDLKFRTGLSPVKCNIKNLKSTWGVTCW